MGSRRVICKYSLCSSKPAAFIRDPESFVRPDAAVLTHFWFNSENRGAGSGIQSKKNPVINRTILHDLYTVMYAFVKYARVKKANMKIDL